MKKGSRKIKDDLRPEYKRSDFTSLVRGKFAGHGRRNASDTARLHGPSNVVTLDPDVAVAFPNGRAVNNALRSLIKREKAPRRRTATGKRSRRVRRAR